MGNPHVCNGTESRILESRVRGNSQARFGGGLLEKESQDHLASSLPYLDQVLPYLDDPRYVEAIDELFIRRIEEILEGMYDWHFRHSTQEAIGHATQTLALFRDNANLGKGVGVDEYENTPPAVRKAPGKPTHNTKVVRGLVLDHLRDGLQTDRKDVSSALRALRLSTRQALHEGWLPI